jgi:hypothetical protein
MIAAETDFLKPEVKLFRRWLLAELGIGDERPKSSRPGARPFIQ